MASVGTAYVQVRGDLSQLNKQLVANLHPSRLGKLGKVAGAAAGVGLAAGFGAKALFDIGKQFDDAFDTIRTSTGKTGKSLRGLEDDFKAVVQTVPTDFDSASRAVGGLSQRLGIVGKPLQKLSRQILQLSKITGTDVGENVAAVTRLFGDWGVATNKQGPALNRLFRVTQKTGIQLGDLSRFMVAFGSPLRQLGFGFDEAVAMFGKFEKEGVNLQTIMPGFRFALKNLSAPTGEAAAALKKLGISAKDPKVALQEVFAAIKKAPTDLKANAIAFAIFGKRAGPDMAAAIREGRFEYGNLIKQMRSGKDTINSAEKDTRDFSEEWQLFKNQVMVTLEPIASSFFKSVGDGMRGLRKILTDPNLTAEEKVSKIFDVMLEKVNVAMPKIADAVGQAAPQVALAFVKGFLNAGAWGQLAVGGLLLAKFGKLGSVFKGAGAVAGTEAAVGAEAGMAAGLGGAFAGSGAINQSLARFAPLMKKAAIVAGAIFTIQLAKSIKDSKSVPDALQRIPKTIGNVVLPFGQQKDQPLQAKTGKEFLDVLVTRNIKAQNVALKQNADALGIVRAATQQAQQQLPNIISAERRLAQLRKEGRGGSHEAAVALRELDAAEGLRLAALRARTGAEEKARASAGRNVEEARKALEAGRIMGLSQKELLPLIRNLATANRTAAASSINLSRAFRGLTPITDIAKKNLGGLLDSLKGLKGFGDFKKFLITADIGSVNTAIRVVGKLQDLGRQKTALKIIAESKNPEDALKRLRDLLRRLEERRHRFAVEMRDEATLRLDRLIRKVNNLPRGKVTVDVVGGRMSVADKLERSLRDAWRRAASAGVIPVTPKFPKARGGRVGRPESEAMTLVGEEGPELVRLPVGSRVFSNPQSKRMAKQMGIQAFAKGGVVKPQKKRKKDENQDPTAREGQPPEPTEAGKRRERQKRKAPRSTDAQAIVSRANKLDLLDLPYRWGGGHGSVAEALRSGFDCSGAVSYVLGIKPRVSGALAGYGSPGKGPVTIFANAKHTFMSIFGRGFGTSKENPDGGAGWLSYNDRAGFTASHLANITASDEAGARRPQLDRSPKRLSLGQLVSLAKRVGFPDPALAAAVAYAESKGNVGATHVNAGGKGTDHGLWQINDKYHPQYDAEKLESDIFYNAQAALAISKHGKTWQPWHTYTHGQYKDFLGGKAAALPRVGGGAGGSNSYADTLAFKLEEAKFLTPNNFRDDLKWINKAITYWTGVYRRNRGGGGNQRARDAIAALTTLKEERRTARNKGKDPQKSAYELTPLGKQIGKGGAIFSVQNLQGVLDSIENKAALAALTEWRNTEGDFIPPTWTDDMVAATDLQNLWQYLFELTSGKDIPNPSAGHWADVPGTGGGVNPGSPPSEGMTWTGTKWQKAPKSAGSSPGKGYVWDGLRWTRSLPQARGPQQVWVSDNKPMRIVGTIKQQTYAAQQLKEARDAVRSIQEDAKAEGADISTAVSPAQDMSNFLTSIRELIKQFGSNIKPLQNFGTGGIIQGPKGKAVVIQGHGGEAVINERGDLQVIVKQSDGQEKAQVIKNIDARSYFKEVPPDPHAYAKAVDFELKGSV